eukprot:3322299-Rhodomonas_salina.1
MKPDEPACVRRDSVLQVLMECGLRGTLRPWPRVPGTQIGTQVPCIIMMMIVPGRRRGGHSGCPGQPEYS